MAHTNRTACCRVGPDERNLGADVNLVGPGPAYEQWKKTQEHQEWLK